MQSGTGTPPFHFYWTLNSTINASGSSIVTLSNSNSSYYNNVITFKVTGTFAVTIKVVDKYGSTSSESLTIVVHTPLLVVSTTVTATPSSLDLGGSTSITATPDISGGTSPYKYQWYRNGTATSDKVTASAGSGTAVSGTEITLPQTPTVTGTYTYYLVITDSAYSAASYSTSVTVTVNKVPTSSSIGISPTSTVVNKQINATVTSGYGTSPYNYTWTVTPTGGSSKTYYGDHIKLGTAGNYTVSLKVKDADGKIAFDNTTLRIYSNNLVSVSITSPTTSPTIDVGHSQSISGEFSSGSGTYEYQWLVQTSATPSNPSTGYTSGSSPQSYTFTPSSSGTFYVFLYVKDTVVGDTQSSYEKVTVNKVLVQSAITVSPTSTSKGSPVTASITSGYGVSPYTYSWTITTSTGGSATGDYNESGDQVTFSKTGNYTVSVKATDAESSTATSVDYNIDVSVAVSLTASIYTSPTSGITAIDVKHALVFDSTVAGGSGSYTYAWQVNKLSGTVGTSSSYTLNVTTPGLYVIYLNVTHGGSKASASPITIVVNPLPTVSFPVTGTIQTDVGASITGSVSGGTPKYSYSWSVTLYPSGNPASNEYSTSGNTITFKTAGDYTVKFTATDADNSPASVTSKFEINYQLSGTLNLSSSQSSVIDRGNSSLLNVTIVGGSGDFSYQWFEKSPGSSFPLEIYGATNSSYDFVTTPKTPPGVYQFYVNITDLGTDPVKIKSNVIDVTVNTAIIYQVTFTESGLPSGTYWYINITNGKSYSTSSNKITFLEKNGTYSFSVATGNSSYKLSTGSSGSFSLIVNGGAVSRSLTFLSEVYSVTFSEFGLETGTKWFVNLSSGQSYSSDLSVISFSETNGTYYYSVATDNKRYKPDLYSSKFTISGRPISELATFRLVTYNVTFDETGLPKGTNWFVNLTDGQSYNSTTSSLKFPEPNGTYSYDTATSEKIYYSRGGTFVVDGSPIAERSSFSYYLYNISFKESGLPLGTLWNVTLLGPQNDVVNSSNDIIYFEMWNGTYTFEFGTVSGYAAAGYNVTVVVDGSPVRYSVVWTVVTYPVTIVETGLSQGALWSISLTSMQGGQEKTTTINSTTNSITFNVTNGSYAYVVTLPKGYKGSPASSTIAVAGSAVTTKLKVTALPNYMLIWIIIAVIAIVVVVMLLVVRASNRSLFKREGRFLRLTRSKGKR